MVVSRLRWWSLGRQWPVKAQADAHDLRLEFAGGECGAVSCGCSHRLILLVKLYAVAGRYMQPSKGTSNILIWYIFVDCIVPGCSGSLRLASAGCCQQRLE